MSSNALIVVLVAMGGGMLVVFVAILAKGYRSVPPDRALIVSGLGAREPRVTFSGGAFVMPIVQRAEVVDLGVKVVAISRMGKEGVVCADNIRADLKVRCLVRINRTTDDVLTVARSAAPAGATLDDLFAAKFASAIKTAVRKLEFEQLYTRRDDLQDDITALIGKDLNGYVLDDVAIDFLEQTPLAVLDPNNVIDALGIRKISEVTDAANDATNRLRHQAKMRPAPANPDHPAPLVERLGGLGLPDIHLTVEVSCDVPADRAALTLAIDGATDTVMTRLAHAVPHTIVTAAGRGTLAIADGRATFRWTDPTLDEDELIAGARLVHALRVPPATYR